MSRERANIARVFFGSYGNIEKFFESSFLYVENKNNKIPNYNQFRKT